MPVHGIATKEEKFALAYDLAMAYMSQQDNSNLSPTEYYQKFVNVRSELFAQFKDLADPYRP